MEAIRALSEFYGLMLDRESCYPYNNPPAAEAPTTLQSEQAA